MVWYCCLQQRHNQHHGSNWHDCCQNCNTKTDITIRPESTLSVIPQAYYPAFGCGSGGVNQGVIANFGKTPFVYPVPAGFTGGVY